MSAENTTQDTGFTENNMSELHHKFVKSAYAAEYDELPERRQEEALRILGDMPQPILDFLDDNAFNGGQVKAAMNDAFELMQDQGFSDEELDGAAILAKGVEKRLGIEEAEVA